MFQSPFSFIRLALPFQCLDCLRHAKLFHKITLPSDMESFVGQCQIKMIYIRIADFRSLCEAVSRKGNFPRFCLFYGNWSARDLHVMMKKTKTNITGILIGVRNAWRWGRENMKKKFHLNLELICNGFGYP